MSASLTKAQRFDPVASFTPLGTVATSGLALTVTQSFPAATLEELLREARANPGKLNYSSPGTGTLQHLGMELFKLQLKLDVVHVPYRGAATALTDLITGQVLKTGTVQEGTSTIDMGFLKSGLYVMVFEKDGQRSVQKFIRQ